jgi:hypothetical protein
MQSGRLQVAPAFRPKQQSVRVAKPVLLSRESGRQRRLPSRSFPELLSRVAQHDREQDAGDADDEREGHGDEVLERLQGVEARKRRSEEGASRTRRSRAAQRRQGRPVS